MIERMRRIASRNTTTTIATSSASSNVATTPGSQQRSPLKARPKVLRAVYAVGLMCKYFSLEDLANAAFALVNDPSSTAARYSSVDLSILTHQVNTLYAIGTFL